MTLKINYLAKFLNSPTKNIAFFLEKNTEISKLAQIIGDKSISSTLNKLIKNENFTKKKIITSIDKNIDKKFIFIWVDNNLSSYEVENPVKIPLSHTWYIPSSVKIIAKSESR